MTIDAFRPSDRYVRENNFLLFLIVSHLNALQYDTLILYRRSLDTFYSSDKDRCRNKSCGIFHDKPLPESMLTVYYMNASERVSV